VQNALDLLDVGGVVFRHVAREVRYRHVAAFGVGAPALPLLRCESGEQAQVGFAQEAEHLDGLLDIPRVVPAAPGPLLLIEAGQGDAGIFEHLAVSPTAGEFVLGEMCQDGYDTPFAGCGRPPESRCRYIGDEAGQCAGRFVLSGNDGFNRFRHVHIIPHCYNFRMRLAVVLLAVPLFAQTYDVVVANGRVLDPASNLDAVRYVGISGGKIAAVSATALTGRATIDAKGLVVAPGFIDLHSHGQTPENYRFKARDGVTTALELEVGVHPVAAWYAQREGHSLINFGATSGEIPARIAEMHDSGTLLPRDRAVERAATPEEFREILARVGRGLDEGAVGIGLGIAYLPHESRAEVVALFRLAAARKVTLFVHMRNGGPIDPGVIDALQETIADAAATGASVHVVHITSMGLRETALCLEMIQGARARGLDITTEAYPYTAGMTDLGSAIFSEGWQGRQGGITFGDLQWALTGERLTAESFARYRKQGGFVAIHSIPEEIVRLALSNPMVMVASDGVLDEGKGHPRAAGTYARVLGRYVREQHALSLMDAIRKMTVMPADRLGLKSKGRIAVGADADLTVLDPERVTDRATFEKPAQYSEGIPYVMVNGTLVVNRGELVSGAAPGRGVRR
jgi:N-acyl-D-aspartate/D-glutamate deacylase